jgi:hypothetical protein
MPHHMAGVYDGFDSIDEVRPFYKRCRTTKCFILKPEEIERLDPICAGCGKKFSEHSKIANDWAEPDSGLQYNFSRSDMLANRAWYDPKTGKIAIFQYRCAWTTILNRVFAMADRMY